MVLGKFPKVPRPVSRILPEAHSFGDKRGRSPFRAKVQPLVSTIVLIIMDAGTRIMMMIIVMITLMIGIIMTIRFFSYYYAYYY